MTRALRNVQVAVHRSRHRWLSPGSVVATNLYNARPSQLADAHATLDQAVWTAYGLPEPPEETDDETILARRVALNLERSST